MCNTNWNIISTHDINLSQFNNPADICGYFRNNKIKEYLYRINYKGIVLKFGMSEGNQPNPGDRLYRQVGHSQTWPAPLNGPNGADWLIIERDMHQKYGITMHKDDITVKIWNLTKYPFNTINQRAEIERMEAELIDQYVSVVGQKPLGNIYDTEYALYRYNISKNVMTALFEEFF